MLLKNKSRKLVMFLSAHYAGEDLCPKFEQGEPWKKVFGPVFIYLNSIMDGKDPLTLWDDAKTQHLLGMMMWANYQTSIRDAIQEI
ncbi:hypothetical protein AgCh_022151 [Apium graveolens]